ncbi:MAG: O-antigen ligase family protein, partial [Pseudomonadota bacterium]
MSDQIYDPRSSFLPVAAALWLLGFVFSLMPLAAYEAESFLLSVLCVGFASLFTLAAALVSAIKAVFVKPVVWVALGFWALALLSVFLSEIPFVSFIYFCFFSVFPLSFFMLVFQGGYEHALRFLAAGLAIIFSALGVSCLVQYFAFPEMLFRGFVSWPLANPNGLAALLSLAFFASIGWMIGAPNRRQSNLALALSALLAVSIFVTGSRGALVALLMMLGVFLFFVRAQAAQHKRCLFALMLLSLLSFALVSLFAPITSIYSPAELISRSVTGAQPLLWSRPEIWASTWEIIQNNFWTGTGIGTFFLYYPEVRSIGDPSTAGLMAHSDPLQFWAEMGILSLVLFYVFIALCVLRTRAAFKKLDQKDTRRVTILVPFFAIAAMTIHAHVSFPFHILPTLLMAGFLLGVWFVQTQNVLDGEVKADNIPHENIFLRWALALPVVALLGVFSLFQASEILVTRGHNHMMSGNMDAFVQET